MPEESDWKELVKHLNSLFEKSDCNPEEESIKNLLMDKCSVTIALAMEEIKPEQAVHVFNALDKPMATDVLAKLDPEHTKEIIARLQPDELPGLIESLPPREAAAVLAEVPRQQLRSFVNENSADSFAVDDAQNRLKYPNGTAGRFMTIQFVRLHSGMTVGDAMEVVRHTDPNVDIPGNLYVVDRDKSAKTHRDRLLGVISIRGLLMCAPAMLVDDVMTTDIVSIQASADEKNAAALLSKYKFTSLPVTDKDGFLVGVIPADDLMPVIVGRLRSLYSKAVGTDAEKMEQLTPFQEAKLRVPWLLGTMGIELGAGLVISHFDAVLQKVILLASFMPVISAISGNVGLQAAAITVRALDTGARKSMWGALKKEGATSLLMALVCGLTLGAIGAFWAKHLSFGIVIGAALTCSMLTAGLMGTVIPVISKRLGFDPATTAGPFETAFQDVVGFAVFLWLATLLQNWIA